MQDELSARQTARGDLDFVVCEECGFAFNRAFDFSMLAYGEHYDNTQACSPSFSEYITELARSLVFENRVRNSRVVEVGCGNGLFLRKLVETEGANNIGYGFDPSHTGPATELGGRLRFERRYYGPECADVHADVVICRHVIEHVPFPLELLEAVRKALANSIQARVFFETPCIEWIIRNQVIWDFFYEHCSLFSADSIRTAFEIAGFEVNSVRHQFGGQYLWIEASLARKERKAIRRAGTIPSLTEQFALSEDHLKSQWLAKAQSLSDKGKLAVWGAGAKGVTFVNLIDPDRKLIDCVVDLNPNKQGRYIPGTGHPIVNYREIASRGVRAVILMNPNYRDENLRLIHEAELDVDLVE
jgi:SAM-dependent methyltransferase